jgi:hypothetical protein
MFMRQHRLKPHRTIDYVVMNEPCKFARIMPPQQTHSYEHIQQSSQHVTAVQQQTARAWTGNMRQQRLRCHRTLNYVVIRGLPKFGRISPPQENAQLWARTAGQSAAANSKSLDM